jgi:hypothetical protein
MRPLVFVVLAACTPAVAPAATPAADVDASHVEAPDASVIADPPDSAPFTAIAPRDGCAWDEPSDPNAVGACHSNADCDDGRCVTFASNTGAPPYAPMNRNSCVHEECMKDTDCGPGISGRARLCACHSRQSDTNRCKPGDCHYDSDCPAGEHCKDEPENYYKPKRDRGRYCTTANDTCKPGGDCTFCVFDTIKKQWWCDARFIPPPG